MYCIVKHSYSTTAWTILESWPNPGGVRSTLRVWWHGPSEGWPHWPTLTSGPSDLRSEKDGGLLPGSLWCVRKSMHVLTERTNGDLTSMTDLHSPLHTPWERYCNHQSCDQDNHSKESFVGRTWVVVLLNQGEDGYRYSKPSRCSNGNPWSTMSIPVGSLPALQPAHLTAVRTTVVKGRGRKGRYRWHVSVEISGGCQ